MVAAVREHSKQEFGFYGRLRMDERVSCKRDEEKQARVLTWKAARCHVSRLSSNDRSTLVPSRELWRQISLYISHRYRFQCPPHHRRHRQTPAVSSTSLRTRHRRVAILQRARAVSTSSARSQLCKPHPQPPRPHHLLGHDSKRRDPVKLPRQE